MTAEGTHDLIDDVLAGEAGAAVHWVLRLRLSEPGWAEVEKLLDDLEAALRDGDADALRDTIVDLDGVRVAQREGRSENDKKAPAPPPVRERGARLLDSLVPASSPDPDAGGVRGR